MELDWLNFGTGLFDGLSIKAGGKPEFIQTVRSHYLDLTLNSGVFVVPCDSDAIRRE